MQKQNQQPQQLKTSSKHFIDHQHIQSRGKLMRLESSGQGDDILILHGCGAPGTALVPLAERLSQTHRVWLPDMPGYITNRDVPYMPTPQLVASLRDALLARGVERVALIGHSFGSFRLAHMALIAAPLKLTALIALSPASSMPEDAFPPLRDFAEALRTGVDMSQAAAERWYGPAYYAAHPELVAQMRSWMDSYDLTMPSRELPEPFDGGALGDQLHELPLPLYIRVGDEDLATPAWIAESMFARVKRGELSLVKGIGHMLIEEDMEPTLAWIHAALHASRLVADAR
jgi:pimeloyl-ACP methyl ester carboxylesterase